MQGRLLVLGLALTAGYLYAVSWVLDGKLGDFQWLALNEAGDFFAGVFGPLTLIWLILGFVQQGYELSQNTKVLGIQTKELENSVRALNLQAQELQNSVEQQKALVEVARQELEASKAAHDWERERTRQALEEAEQLAKPKFHFNQGSTSAGTGGRAYEVYVSNSGSECSDWSMRLVNATNLVLPTPQRLPVFPRGRPISLRFQSQATTEAAGILEFFFTDARGRPASSQFQVRVDEATNTILVRPLPPQ